MARDGVPPNPGGWIVTTAKRRAIDWLRRESSREARQAQAQLLHARDDLPEVGPVHDDRLRLLFTCCHPALAVEARVALTLRLLGGLETSHLARAFLVPEPTMAQRLVRARRKIRDAGIPTAVVALNRAVALAEVEDCSTTSHLLMSRAMRAVSGPRVPSRVTSMATSPT